MEVRWGAEELNHSGSDDFSVVEIVVGWYHDGAFWGGVMMVVVVGRMDVESGGWFDGSG